MLSNKSYGPWATSDSSALRLATQSSRALSKLLKHGPRDKFLSSSRANHQKDIVATTRMAMGEKLDSAYPRPINLGWRVGDKIRREVCNKFTNQSVVQVRQRDGSVDFGTRCRDESKASKEVIERIVCTESLQLSG